MKICIVMGAFLPVPPIKGGAVEKMWWKLAYEFVTIGHEVVVISKSHEELPRTDVTRGLTSFRVKGYDMPRSGLLLKVFDFLYSRRACRMIPSDADVVVTNTFWAPTLMPALLASRAYVDVARMPKGQMRIYSRVGRLRANSTPVAAAIRAELPSHLHGLVHIIPNPLPFDGLAPVDGLEARKAMLYVGRVHPEKGIHVLIGSLQHMKEPWQLRIVGPWRVEDGGGGESYLRELKMLAANRDVEFVEPIYDSDKLAHEYRGAGFFVYPSLAEKGETFGLAPLEAMSMGCAVVVSDLACFKDFIIDGENGMTFDHRSSNPEVSLAECLQKLANDDQALTAIRTAALRVKATHSARHIAELFIADFHVVADKTR